MKLTYDCINSDPFYTTHNLGSHIISNHLSPHIHFKKKKLTICTRSVDHIPITDSMKYIFIP